MSAVPVSVLVATKNEAGNIVECLAALAWADEVVVIDSGSTDGTAEIAGAHGARVVQFPGVEVTDRRKRTWAIAELDFAHEWLLVIDADERTPPEFGDAISAIVTGRPEHDAYRIRFRRHFMGQWIRHAGWYPATQIRLFRRGAATYEAPDMVWSPDMGDVEVHEQIAGARSVGEVDVDVMGHDFTSLGSWLAKHNRYSTWEAQRRVAGLDRRSTSQVVRAIVGGSPTDRRRALRTIALHVPFRPLLTFVWLYVVRRGFLDGRIGLRFCALHAMHQMHVDAKVEELEAATRSS